MDVLPYLWRLALHDSALRPRLALSLALLVCAKTAGLAVPLLFSRAVDAVSNGATLYNVLLVLGMSGACKAVSGAASEARSVVFTPVAQTAGRKIATALFSHILALDIQFHMNYKMGTLNRTIERGTRSVTMVFRAVVFTFLPTAVELILVSALLWHQFHPSLVLTVIATFAAYTAWTVSLAKLAASRRKEQNRLDSLASGAAVDTLLNTETIQNFGNGPLRCNQYNHLLKDYQEAQQRTERVSCLLNAGQAVILACGVTGVLSSAVLCSYPSSAADLVLVNGLLLQLWAPLQFLGYFYRELRQSLVDIEQMFAVFETKSQVPDGGRELKPGTGGVSISLKDVHFGYNDRRNVVKGVSLDIAAGESLAIVGPSGSGKSTLLRLILRMYDVSKGSVHVEGVDVKELKLSSLREVCSVVPQDTAMFNDSLINNIAFGRPGATREEIYECGRAAHLDDAIALMPDGYDTVVGDRGLKLSGGERQRVAIARAFIRDPRLVICDEATSALDSFTERGIQKSLKELSHGRTSVTVAHRLSTVADADRIVVMKAGEIVEVGTHNELMTQNGLYTRMWKMQDKGKKQSLSNQDSNQDSDPSSTISSPAPAPAGVTSSNGSPRS